MVSTSVKLGSTWVQISNDKDYILQNLGTNGKVLVKAAATQPTTTDGVFELNSGAVIASTILNGVVWARAESNEVLVTYAK